MINPSSRAILVCLMVLILSSCSSVSEMYSQKNPKWNGSSFQNVMVVGDFPNLVYRKNAEQYMCNEINNISSTNCFRSLDYVFAGNKEQESITAAMNNLQIDAMIYVSNIKSGSEVVSTPTLSTTSWTSGVLTTIGIGGATSVKWANYSVSVYTPSGAMIWTASINSGGDYKEELISDSSEEIASKLLHDAIIKPPASSVPQ